MKEFMKVFMILSFTRCPALAWKDNWLSMYLRLLQKLVNQVPKGSWLCHDADDPRVLPVRSFSLTSSTSLEQTQPPLLCQTPKPWGSISLSLVNNPKPKEPCVQGLYKERSTGKGHQNKIAFVVYRPLNVTSLHGCHLSRSEPQIQTGIIRKH